MNTKKKVKYLFGLVAISAFYKVIVNQERGKSGRIIYRLHEENSQLRGQLKNQRDMISGLQRTVERTSYINGKYAALSQRNNE